MDDYRQCFATRLNEQRKRKRLSKVNFSLRLTEEVKKVKPSVFESDPTFGSLTVESLYAAAKMFGVTTDYLLGLSDESNK